MHELEHVYRYLKTLSPEFEMADLAPLRGRYRPESYRAKDVIFREGETYRKVTFILRGLVKKSYTTLEGREFIKEFTWEKQITTPYASLLLNQPASYTMEAVEDTDLLTIDYDAIDALFRTDPRWTRLGKAFADFHFLNREAREMELLKLSAGQRYEVFRKRFPDLLKRLKKQDIAGYLGITPVSLSRLEAGG